MFLLLHCQMPADQHLQGSHIPIRVDEARIDEQADKETGEETEVEMRPAKKVVQEEEKREIELPGEVM